MSNVKNNRLRNRFTGPKVLKAMTGGKSDSKVHALIMINGEERIVLCSCSAKSKYSSEVEMSAINCSKCIKRMSQIDYVENMKCPTCKKDMKFNPSTLGFTCDCGIEYNL